MERDTKEVITPVGAHKVILKSWITGREKRQLQAVFLTDFKIEDQIEGVPKTDMKFDSSKLAEYQDKLIEMLVVSVNGVNDKIIDLILDMNAKDTDFVIEQINNLVNDETSKKK